MKNLVWYFWATILFFALIHWKKTEKGNMNEKTRLHCANCGNALTVFIAAGGKAFCDQSCRNFYEATHDAPGASEKQVCFPFPEEEGDG